MSVLRDLNELPEASRSEIQALLRSGKRIAAIKKVRSETGAGLKEAKEAVEAYMAAHGIQVPEGSTGCALVLALLGAGLALALAIA